MKVFNLSKTLMAGLIVILTVFAASAQPCTFTPDFKADTNICFGSTVSYTATKHTGNTYGWSVDKGRILSGAGSDSIVVIWHTPGIGSIRLIESSGSCTDTLIRPVLIGPSMKKLTVGKYALLGNASESGGVITLTTNSNNLTGGAWYPNKISLDNSFDFSFQVDICGAADGMIFVLQNTGTSNLGGGGGSLGYFGAASGVFDESFGIELDIYNNGLTQFDSSNSHIALVKNKSFTTLRKQHQVSNPTIGGQCAPVPFRVSWNVVLKELEVWYDSIKIYTYENDLKNTVFGGDPYVYFGFTGATGGAVATQKFSTDSLLVSVVPLNIPADINQAQNLCEGDTLVYDIKPPAGMALSDYGTKWKVAGVAFETTTGGTTSNTSMVYPTTSSNGKFTFFPSIADTGKTYLLSLVIENADYWPCDSIFSKYVKVYSPPKAAFNASATSVCRGTPITFTNTSISATEYKWYIGNGLTKTDTSFTYNYPDEGTYTVSLVSSNPGCRDSVAKTITIVAPATGANLIEGTRFDGYFFNGTPGDPDLTCVRDTLMYEISPPPAFANGDYGTKWEVTAHSVKSTGGASSSNYSFTAPSSSGAGYIMFTPKFAEADLTFIISTTFKALNSACTKDTMVVRYVTVSTSPTAGFNIKGQCAGEPTFFTDASVVAPGLVVRKYEFGVNNAFATTANPSYTYTTAGEYTVTYTVTGKGGCDDVLKKKITIYDKPTADFSMPSTICAGNPAAFMNTSTGNGTTITRYKWTFNQGTTPDTSDQANVSYTFVNSGSYTATLQVWTDGGCNSSVSKTITVVDAPTADFPLTKGCINEPITFVNNSTDAVSYEWRFSDKDTIRTKDAVKTFKFKSSYSVTLVATSASGCRDSVTRQIDFHDQPEVDFTSTGNCAGRVVNFQDATTFPTPSSSAVEWTWIIEGQKKTGDKTSYTFATAGTYNVKLKVKSNYGCSDSFTKAVTINPAPVAGMTLPGSACVNVASTFENTSTGTGNSYLWHFGDGETSADEKPSHTYDATGTYNVKLVTTNSSGCKDSVTGQLTVGLGPEIPFVWCAKDKGKVVKFAAKDSSFATYEWDFGDILGGTGTGTNPTYTYLAANGDYTVTLTVTDAAGCVGTHSATVGTGTKDNSTNCIIDIEGMAARKLDVNIYPNPFSNQTRIEYELLKAQQVRVAVWGATGKEVAILSNGLQQAGKQQLTLDASEHNLSTGLYMIRIETEGAVAASQVLRLE